MRKLIPVLLICMMILSACAGEAPKDATEPVGQLQLANPWKSYDSLQEAADVCGFDFPIPMTVAEIYTAQSFRVMNDHLLEVVYRTEDEQITVRMASGENQDISGVYMDADNTVVSEHNGATVTAKQIGNGYLHLVSKDGFSYSLYAPTGYRDGAAEIFLSYLCES